MSIEIIAEIAQGYEGNPKLAELLALGAVRSGADAVKYQLVFADELCVPTYQYHSLFKSLEMDESVWQDIVKKIQDEKKIIYFDVYGGHSLELAKKLGASGVKISTSDFYNTSLIKSAVNLFNKVFISVGGVPIEDVDDLISGLGPSKDKVTLMYGFQAEPTPTEENNLRRIPEFIKRFNGIAVGFMDHSSGDTYEAFYLPLMAASLGVSCIEKHITLDPILQIEDYVSALEPTKFEKFTSIIRKMEPALGRKDFSLTEKEQAYKNRAGKVVVVKYDMRKGHTLGEDDLTLKRVSTDGSPDCFRRLSDLKGKILNSDLVTDSPVTKSCVDG